MPGFFDSIIPQEWLDPLQAQLEKRSLDQTPFDARLKGFGAGALQGLRDLVTPANAVGAVMGAGPVSSLARFAPEMATSMGPVVKGLKVVGDPLQEALKAERAAKYLQRMFQP